MMKKSLTAAVVLGALVAAAGCNQDNKEVLAKLDEISKKMDRLPAGGGGARGQQGPQRPTPDPTKNYAIPVDDAPAVGAPDALVTIVKAYDYACPFCEKSRDTEKQIETDYGDKVRIVYEPFVVHPQMATIPAQAACAAYRQGKFAEYNELIWEKGFKTRQFEEDNMMNLAKEAGLDTTKFAADMKGDCVGWVQKYMNVLASFGVGATPGFFINGRFLSGAQPLPAFKTLIDEELKKAEERVAQGTPKDSYYKTWIIEKGLKKLDAPK